MSNTINEVTDRTNEVPTDNSELTVVDSNTEIVCDDPVEEIPLVKQERTNYEVVFFARYNNGRPSADEITNFFSNYGVVHHVNCPEGRNNAFIFMSSLSTKAEHRRTRTTINQIRNDMTPETQFHVTVASSNRPIQRRQASQYYGGHGSHQPQWRNNYNRIPRQIHNYDNNDQYNNSYNNNAANNIGFRHYNNDQHNNNRYNGQRGNGVRRWNNNTNQNYNNNDQGQTRVSTNTRRGRYQGNQNISVDGITNQKHYAEPAQVRDTSDSVRRNTRRQPHRIQ